MTKIILSETEKKRILELYSEETAKTTFDATKMRASQTYWDIIKEFEGDPKNRKNGVKQPLLTAYKDTRGIWTIGYGHTGTDVKEGTKITEAQANELLKSDSKIAADCVRRIFQQWKIDGQRHKLTQGQFDALVSIVFNTGCDGLRTSQIIKELKKGKDTVAAEQIKTFKIEGGVDRRLKESEVFSS